MLARCMWVKHPHIEESKKASCRLSSQKPWAWMFNCALSWPFTVWGERVSPVSGRRFGSVWMPWYTSESRFADRSLNSLCRMKAITRAGQGMFYTELCTTDTFVWHSLRLPTISHVDSIPQGSLFQIEPMLFNWPAVSQLDVPFSAAGSIILRISVGPSSSYCAVASAVCDYCCWEMVILACVCLA